MVREPNWLYECRRCVTHYRKKNVFMKTFFNALNIPSVVLASYISYYGISNDIPVIQSTGISLLVLLLATRGLKLNEWAELCSLLSKGYASIIKEFETHLDVTDIEHSNPTELLESLKSRYLALEAQERVLPLDTISGIGLGRITSDKRKTVTDSNPKKHQKQKQQSSDDDSDTECEEEPVPEERKIKRIPTSKKKIVKKGWFGKWPWRSSRESDPTEDETTLPVSKTKTRTKSIKSSSSKVATSAAKDDASGDLKTPNKKKSMRKRRDPETFPAPEIKGGEPVSESESDIEVPKPEARRTKPEVVAGSGSENDTYSDEDGNSDRDDDGEGDDIEASRVKRS